eukprot:TRINITY_DN2719_c0_g1_i1.p1 TRINITY_DN2719_c0_g1~~TRINITY_DN2719_c0_g1_i1.p1  ORF type:complete len:865 (-),score=149.43 TRINITY_DN2719_c0_g1_i1:7-2601(-)
MYTPKGINFTPHIATPVVRPSLQDHEEEVAELRKQNFNLKLRCYYLEEKLNTVLNDDGAEIVRKNVELCVRIREKERDIDNKDVLLRKARATITKLSQQLEEANEGAHLQMQSALDESLSHEWTSRELQEQESRVASLEFQSTSLTHERDILLAQMQASENKHQAEVASFANQIAKLQQTLGTQVDMCAQLTQELAACKNTCAAYEQATERATLKEQRAAEQLQQMLGQLESMNAQHRQERHQLQTQAAEDYKVAASNWEQEIGKLRAELAAANETTSLIKSRLEHQLTEKRQESEISMNMLQLEVSRLRAELDLQTERESNLQHLLAEYLATIADGEHKLRQSEATLERTKHEIVRLTAEGSERQQQQDALMAELILVRKHLKDAEQSWEHERSILHTRHRDELRSTTASLHQDHASAEEKWQTSLVSAQQRCIQLQENYASAHQEISQLKSTILTLQSQIDNCKLDIAQAEQHATVLQQRLGASSQTNEALRVESQEQRTVIEHYHQLILLTRARLVDFLTEAGDNTVARFLGTPLAQHLKSDEKRPEVDLSPLTPVQLQFDPPQSFLSHRTEAIAKELAADVQLKLAALTQMKTLLQSFYWTLYQKYLVLLGQVNLKASLHNNHIESLCRTVDLLKRRFNLNSEENVQLASRLHAAEVEWEGSSVQVAQLRDLLWQKEEKYLQSVYQIDQQKVRIDTLEELNNTLGAELAAKRQALNAQHLRTANLRLEYETLQASYDRLRREHSETTESLAAVRKDLAERLAEIATEVTQLVEGRFELANLSSGYIDVASDAAVTLRRSWLNRSQSLLGKCRELQRDPLVFAVVPGGTVTPELQVNTHATLRSEERRVGKECRSRWSPYH